MRDIDCTTGKRVAIAAVRTVSVYLHGAVGTITEPHHHIDFNGRAIHRVELDSPRRMTATASPVRNLGCRADQLIG